MELVGEPNPIVNPDQEALPFSIFVGTCSNCFFPPTKVAFAEQVPAFLPAFFFHVESSGKLPSPKLSQKCSLCCWYLVGVVMLVKPMWTIPMKLRAF